MPRLIDADALQAKYKERHNGKRLLLIDVAPTIEPEPRWIPCSERLPDTDRMVLVTAQPKKGPANINRAYHTESGWHGSGSMANVTAWMELPEPYKERLEE